jgi:hypothetical protein
MLFQLIMMLTQYTYAMSDCATVMIIYYKMGKATSESDCCNIPGVTCDNRKKVTKLQWEEHGLTGSIPKEIGGLMNLKLL